MCESGAKKVPIKFDGFEVGSAFVSSDGHIIVGKLNDLSETSKEVQDLLRGGSLDYISIRPRSER